MSDILIIDRSATLAHLAQRTLAAVQINDTRSLVNYTEARDQLRRLLRSGEAPALIILGVQATINASLRALLTLLTEEAAAGVPVLLMTHERTAEIDEWLRNRPLTQVLLWSEFGRIPAAVRRLSSSVVPETAVGEAGPGLRLLFVDDSPSVRLAYRSLLEREGYRVSVAGSVREALEVARRGSFDLVIVDYYLPDGSGDEIVRELPSIPGTAMASAAIITGSYREDVILRCLEAGAVECMFKNEARELFVARVRGLARQIQQQKSIDTERQRLEGILRSVADGVYGVDNEGRISFMNPVALRTLGYAEGDAPIGLPAAGTLHPGDGEAQGQAALAQAYASGEALKGLETVFRHRDGHLLGVECSVLPLTVQNRREGAVVVFRDISERKSADRLQWELSHDALTGAGNARLLHQQLAAEWQRRREHGGYSALLYVDIDRYGFISETAGKASSDRLLVDIAATLRQRLREGDLLARFREDCFVLLLGNVQLDNVFTVADGYRESLHQCRIELFGQARPVTASVGVAILSKDTPSAEHALESARIASQQAKARGRDQTRLHMTESEARVSREIDGLWVERFRDALREGRFEFLAQPIVPLAAITAGEGAIPGWRVGQLPAGSELVLELLLRMVGKDGKWIAPSVFVPLAERVGMMPKIDLWVIARVLRYISGRGLAELPLGFALNVSNTTLRDPDALSLIENLVRGSGVPANKLVFEITETSEMGSVHQARRFVDTLKRLGCRFALDDFGTGFSSFSHLRHLPVDMVKIEGSFVEGLAGNPADRTMVSSIATMAHALGLRVIAEHCEDAATVALLRECGIEYIQGHHVGQPQTLDTLDFARIPGLAAPA